MSCPSRTGPVCCGRAEKSVGSALNLAVMTEWFSIEVVDGDLPARGWYDAYRDSLTETAVSGGALDWAWQETPWGVVFEVEFADEAAWVAFRNQPVVRAALDAVPDPVNGLIVSRGRGGSAGSRHPRRPRPMAGAGAASLPVPTEGDETEGPIEAVGRMVGVGADGPAEAIPAAGAALARSA